MTSLIITSDDQAALEALRSRAAKRPVDVRRPTMDYHADAGELASGPSAFRGVFSIEIGS